MKVANLTTSDITDAAIMDMTYAEANVSAGCGSVCLGPRAQIVTNGGTLSTCDPFTSFHGAPDHDITISCASEGLEIKWARSGPVRAGTVTRQFSVRIDPLYVPASTATLCFGAIVYENHNPQFLDDHTGERECYRIVRTDITGTVQSDPVAGTGKQFRGVQAVLFQPSCSATYQQAVTTDASGTFDIGWTQGEPYCIGPYGSPQTYGNTTYNRLWDPNHYPNSPSGNNPWQNGSWNGWNTSHTCNVASCSGYNFYWIPVQNTPAITKTSSAGGGALKPGDSDTFTVTVTNNTDANLPATNMYDYVPINIDPNTVSWGAMTLTAAPILPGQTTQNYLPASGWGWGICGFTLCQTTNTYSPPAPPGSAAITYALSGTSFQYQNTAYISSSCSVCVGGRPTVAWRIYPAGGSSYGMPAYSQVTFTFSGTVKAEGSIGVVADPGTYCGNVNGTTASPEPNYYSDFSGVLSSCGQDFSGGRQGVWNRGYVTIGAVANIADTYDPIPPGGTNGSVSGCIGKNYLGSYDSGNDIGDNNVGSSNVCGEQVLDGSDTIATTHYVYFDNDGDPTSPKDSGAFTTSTQITYNGGVSGDIYYYLDDQAPTAPSPMNAAAPGGAVDPLGAMTAGCIGSNCTLSTFGPTNNLNHVQFWGPGGPVRVNHSGSGTFVIPGGQYQSFNAFWQNPDNYAVGQGPCNIAYLTTIDFSTVPATYKTVPSNTVCVKHVQITHPGVNANSGNVAGGTLAYNVNCTPDSALQPGSDTASGNIRINPSKGEYVVTAQGGNDGSFKSNNGINNLSQANSGPTCIPEPIGASGTVLTYATTHGKYVSYAGNTFNQINNDAAVNGTVQVAVGNVAIGNNGPVDISGKRYTLYVNGDVHIDSNITNNSGDGSIAIVATGNITVNPRYNGSGVDTISGYYFAGGYLNTCEDDFGDTLNHVGGVAGAPGALGEPQCSTPLTVNGALAAQNLRLNRIPPGPNFTYGEIINLPPQLYLNIPPGLSSTDFSGLQSQHSLLLPRY